MGPEITSVFQPKLPGSLYTAKHPALPHGGQVWLKHPRALPAHKLTLSGNVSKLVLTGSRQPNLEDLKRRMMSWRVAATTKYSCFSRSSLPSKNCMWGTRRCQCCSCHPQLAAQPLEMLLSNPMGFPTALTCSALCQAKPRCYSSCLSGGQPCYSSSHATGCCFSCLQRATEPDTSVLLPQTKCSSLPRCKALYRVFGARILDSLQ